MGQNICDWFLGWKKNGECCLETGQFIKGKHEPTQRSYFCVLHYAGGVYEIFCKFFVFVYSLMKKVNHCRKWLSIVEVPLFYYLLQCCKSTVGGCFVFFYLKTYCKHNFVLHWYLVRLIFRNTVSRTHYVHSRCLKSVSVNHPYKNSFWLAFTKQVIDFTQMCFPLLLTPCGSQMDLLRDVLEAAAPQNTESVLRHDNQRLH